MIQVFSNSLGEEEIKAIRPILESKWIGFGKEAKLFEKEFSEHIGYERVLLVNCCTTALFLSVKVLDIGPGDEVIIPSINFPGVANAVIEAGAKPIFCDVDMDYLNIMPSEIKRLRNKNTKAVFLLHYGGHPSNMDEVYKYSEGLFIIEDSANSILSKYKGRNCGTLGDAGSFSFDAMKILCMGDGGAFTVKNEEMLDKAKQLRYLGIRKSQTGIDSLKDRQKRWWEIELGTTSNRYVTNDILSAIGRVQLKKVDSFIKRRKEIWGMYQDGLKGLDWLECPPEPLKDTESSYYLYWIKVKNGLRDELAKFLVDNDIYCTFRYFPLHLVKYYGSSEKLKNAEALNESVLNIPLHQNLSDEDVEKIIKTIKNFPIKKR